jgi:hypothetical protein
MIYRFARASERETINHLSSLINLDALMNDFPSQDLRSNLATWAVPAGLVPAVTAAITDALPPEVYDPHFRGQHLETTYFDTARLQLRQARHRRDHYLTLRVRRYCSPDHVDRYALSAKTEAQKFRTVLDPDQAELLLRGGDVTRAVAELLPADLFARLLDLTDDESLAPVVAVCARRYAVEDDVDRLTLDLDIHTDTGKCFGPSVLEFKSTDPLTPVPYPLTGLPLRPIKISKFLWATLWR